jgi:RimJ/RimL family protein N-acetyltransferase
MLAEHVAMDFAFRRLTDGDLPLMHRWLNEPGIMRWWEGDDVSWDGVVRQYGSANEDPGEHWLASVDDEAVGWIQCYAWADYAHEEEARAHFALGVEQSAAGIDYLLGDPARRGQRLGSAMIRAFVHDVVFGLHPGWTQASAGPYEANTASWRALQHAGFRELGRYSPDGEGECRVMVMNRPTT